MNHNVIITCAVTGAIHTPTMSPYLPITPQEIADAIKKQAQTLEFFPLWSYATPPAIELAERLAGSVAARTVVVVDDEEGLRIGVEIGDGGRIDRQRLAFGRRRVADDGNTGGDTMTEQPGEEAQPEDATGCAAGVDCKKE